jgi:glutamine synthetase
MAPKVYAPTGKVEPFLDHSITRFYLSNEFIADQGGKIIAEYVWIGGSGQDLRSKARTLNKVPSKPEDLPTWNYDGSSTGQAPGEDSEVYLVPRSIFRDPFRGGDNILVMCDCYEPPRQNPDGTVTDLVPIPTNTRAACAAAMEKAADEEPWFGIEQEYTLLNALTKWPLGWPDNGYPAPQGPYYCSAGAGCSIGRDLCDVHYKMCLYAGVNISGVNAEVMPAQWEYQVGPCVGIDSGDHMWMSRYLLYRVGEIFNVDVTFDPKPIPGDWNGAGGHTNYSTKATRAAGTGWDAIQEQIAKLEKRHAVHIASYGEGNERRLTGKHETSSMEKFSWGVANRGCSIRVGRSVPVEKSGYYEDRRPASNLDPYVVTRLLVESTLLM